MSTYLPYDANRVRLDDAGRQAAARRSRVGGRGLRGRDRLAVEPPGDLGRGTGGLVADRSSSRCWRVVVAVDRTRPHAKRAAPHG
jgi:hypothetical protein